MDLNAGNSQDQCTYKIVVIGKPGVGKTSLILRYTDDIFSESPTKSVCAKYRVRQTEVGDKRFQLEIWDTTGRKNDRTYSGQTDLYSETSAFIIVFDLTDEESFQSVRNWVGEIYRYAGNSHDTLLILAGNKVDLDNIRIVDRRRAEIIAESEALSYIEVSAKTGYGVKAMFEALPNGIFEEESRALHPTHVVSTARNASEEKPCCNIC